jgi:putative ABC transport system permease protein
MGGLLAQIKTVVTMNIISLPQRGWMAGATLLAVAVVVAVLLAFLAMANGFKSTVQNSGSNALGIALRAGSQAELNSGLGGDQVKLLEEAPGIKRNADGPIKSAELYVVVDGVKKSTGTDANLSLRGIEPDGIELRPTFNLIEGRLFIPGKNEVIVGQAVSRDYQGFELNNEIKLGQATWTIVGIFATNGSVYESELWTDVRTVQTQFNRGNSYQTVRFALENEGDIAAIQAYVDANPQLNLDISTERDYFSEQASGLFNVIFYIGWPLAIIMAFGALSGALNAMYSSVAQRTREIATLRALGFSGFSAFIGTMVESIVLAIAGGLLGTIAAYFFFNGMTASTLGGSFTQIVFNFELSPSSLKDGILLAFFIGLIGGFFPALKAARVPVLKAFAMDS